MIPYIEIEDIHSFDHGLSGWNIKIIDISKKRDNILREDLLISKNKIVDQIFQSNKTIARKRSVHDPCMINQGRRINKR